MYFHWIPSWVHQAMHRYTCISSNGGEISYEIIWMLVLLTYSTIQKRRPIAEG